MANTLHSTPSPLAGAAPATKKNLYLDVHDLGPGNVHLKDAAAAHELDLAAQGKHGVNYKAYWVDEKQGKLYCLVEAPSPEAAAAVHREAHGLLAHDIMEAHGLIPNEIHAVLKGR